VPLLKISDIAQKAKVLPSTIRHYTDLGLVEFSDRTEGGQRLYDEERHLFNSQNSTPVRTRIYAQPGKRIICQKSQKAVLIVDDDPDVSDLIKLFSNKRTGNSGVRQTVLKPARYCSISCPT